MSHSFRNLSIIAGIAIIAVSGGYLLQQAQKPADLSSSVAALSARPSTEQATSTLKMAQFIPANSRLLWFAPHPDAHALLPQVDEVQTPSEIEELQRQSQRREMAAAYRFYSAALADLLAQRGTVRNQAIEDLAIYFVDQLPVLRIKISATEAEKRIVHIEQIADVQATSAALGEIAYRAYAADAQGKTQLILAQRGDYLVATVSTPQWQEQLKTALSAEPLAQNLQDSGKIEQWQKKYQLQTNSFPIFYADLAGILQDAADPNHPLFSQWRLFSDQAGKPLFDATCQKEILQSLAQFPELVISAKHTAENQQQQLPIQVTARLDVADAVLQQSLTPLRGSLPVFSVPPRFGLAVGLDFAALLPVTNALMARVEQVKTPCAPYQNFTQMALRTKGELMKLSMITSLLGGTKGASFSLFDITMLEGGIPDQIDVLMSISADNPLLLAHHLASKLPDLAKLTEENREIELEQTMPELQFKAQVTKGYLLIYTGETAARVVADLQKNPVATQLAGVQLDLDAQFVLNKLVPTLKQAYLLSDDAVELLWNLYRLEGYQLQMQLGIGEQGGLYQYMIEEVSKP